MARMYRLDWQNAFHHVMTRGVAKRNIFENHEDMDRFSLRLRSCLKDTCIQVHAWVLMPNHIHLLTETGPTPLAVFMQKLLTGHALYFNRKYDRVGHLFQGRYKSILVQTDLYFRKLVRYIHLNPIKAGIVADRSGLDEYRWSGHYGIIHRDAYPWQSRDRILGSFKEDRIDPIMSYTDYLWSDENILDLFFEDGSFVVNQAGLHSMLDTTCHSSKSGSGHRILGDRDFALQIVSKLNKRRGRVGRNREKQHAAVEKLLNFTESHWGIAIGELASGRRTRKHSEAREFVSYCLVDILGLTLEDAAGVQHLSRQGVDQSRKRFRARLQHDNGAHSLIHDMRSIISQIT